MTQTLERLVNVNPSKRVAPWKIKEGNPNYDIKGQTNVHNLRTLRSALDSIRVGATTYNDYCSTSDEIRTRLEYASLAYVANGSIDIKQTLTLPDHRLRKAVFEYKKQGQN